VTHSDIQSRMADYLEGDLALGKRALFDAHLDGCEECSRELAAMRETIDLLRGLASPEPPADLAPNVMRRIAEGEGQPRWLDRVAAWFGELNSFLAGPRIAVPVAALAACLAVFVATGERGGFSLSGSEPKAETAQVAQSGGAESRRETPPRVSPEAFVRHDRVSSSPRLGMRGSTLTSEPLQARVDPQHSAGDRSLEMASAQAAGAVEAQSIRTRDEWLEVLIQQPQIFAREHVELSPVEQELWITHLARRAVELRRMDEVLAALRATPDPIAAALADSFSQASPRQEFAGQKIRGRRKR